MLNKHSKQVNIMYNKPLDQLHIIYVCIVFIYHKHLDCTLVTFYNTPGPAVYLKKDNISI